VAGPTVPLEIRQLIREMSIANQLWGAPRIHGELLKLGIDIGQTSVAKYMARRRGSPSQGWKTFLRNHADGIAAIDLFVVPTVSFRLLYGLLIMGHGRRQILWFGVTSHPSADRRPSPKRTRSLKRKRPERQCKGLLGAQHRIGARNAGHVNYKSKPKWTKALSASYRSSENCAIDCGGRLLKTSAFIVLYSLRHEP
jgi:hypothetical protein